MHFSVSVRVWLHFSSSDRDNSDIRLIFSLAAPSLFSLAGKEKLQAGEASVYARKMENIFISVFDRSPVTECS